MAAALTRKSERYRELTITIQGNGYKCLNLPLEIGTRGVVSARNRGVLTQLCHGLKGEQSQQRDQELQQAGPPRLLHPLECQVLERLDWRRLSEAMKSTIFPTQ